MKTVVALFDEVAAARDAVAALNRSGFRRERLTLFGQERGGYGAGPGMLSGATRGERVKALMSRGVPWAAAARYAEGVERGGTVVVVRADDEEAELARDLLEQQGPIRPPGDYRDLSAAGLPVESPPHSPHPTP